MNYKLRAISPYWKITWSMVQENALLAVHLRNCHFSVRDPRQTYRAIQNWKPNFHFINSQFTWEIVDKLTHFGKFVQGSKIFFPKIISFIFLFVIFLISGSFVPIILYYSLCSILFQTLLIHFWITFSFQTLIMALICNYSLL